MTLVGNAQPLKAKMPILHKINCYIHFRVFIFQQSQLKIGKRRPVTRMDASVRWELAFLPIYIYLLKEIYI
jgi:hypothetical protein